MKEYTISVYVTVNSPDVDDAIEKVINSKMRYEYCHVLGEYSHM